MAVIKSKSSGSGKFAAGTSWEGGVKPAVTDTAELVGSFSTGIEAIAKIQALIEAAGYTGTISSTSNVEAGEALANAENVIFKLVSGSGYTWTGELLLKSTNAETQKIFTAAKTLTALGMSKSGKYILEDALTVTGAINLSETASLNTNGQTIKAAQFVSTGTSGSAITLGASKLTITQASGSAWKVELATVSAGTSEITLTGESAVFVGGGKTYNVVVLAGKAQTVESANTFAELAINNKGDTEGITLASALVQTVTTLTTNGTEAEPAKLRASSAGTKAKIKLTGTQTVKYLKCKDIKVETGALKVTIPNGTKEAYDLGGNEGITFEEEASGVVNAQAMMV